MASKNAGHGIDSDPQVRRTFDFVAAGTIPRIGPIGRLARIISGALTLGITFLLADDARRAIEGWDGVSAGAYPMWIGIAILFYFLPYAISTAVGRDWGYRPLIVVLSGAVVAALVGWAVAGSAWGPVPFAYLVIVAAALALEIGVAFIIQAVLATPGCEVRAYADLWSRITGRPVNERACLNPAYRRLDAWEARRGK